MRKINLNNKKILIIIIVLIVLIILLQSYVKIINKHRNNRIFALESEKYAEELNNPIFRIDKIIIYSDANIEDLSENKNMSNINITQFTDFAIYINNTIKDNELTAENTINQIYIDNIGISSIEELGVQKFFTKSIDNLGKYIPAEKDSKTINYNVVHKNSDKEIFDNTNSFYTDCSEPLVLSYVNENIVESADTSNSGERLSLDGSILKYLNIDLKKLNYKINFTINVENNLGENFFCKCSLNVNLDDGEEGIYSGYIMQIFDLSNSDLRFKKYN